MPVDHTVPIRERYRQFDTWLTDHPAAWFVAAVLVPGTAIATVRLLVTDDTLVGALFFGIVFGVTFAAFTMLLR